MNVVELNPTVSDALRRTLAQLPEFDPPASRWLDVIAEARVVRGAPALIAVEADLARVDGALQAAYDRGAAPAELEALWQQRTATLEALLAGYRHPDSLIRI